VRLSISNADKEELALFAPNAFTLIILEGVYSLKII
jgi:hypothetical protein